MGRAALADMLEHATAEQAFGWHMTSNLYPPPPPELHPLLWSAIEAFNAGEIGLDDDWDFEPVAPAQPFRRAVETFRLEGFLDTGG